MYMSPPRKNRPLHRSADKRAILQDHYLFGKLTPQHIDRLSTCIVTRSVKRGTNIFAKGDPGTSLCAIGAGTVRISVPSADGKDEFETIICSTGITPALRDHMTSTTY